MRRIDSAPRGQGGASAGLKFGAALAVVIFTALLPRQASPLYAIPGVLLAVAAFWCRVAPWLLLRRLLVAEIFILGMAALSLLSPATRPVFAAVWLKSNLCVTAMFLLTWTTPFHELLRVMRAWRMPLVMVSTLALMTRYLPLLAEEGRRMERARASRTFAPRRRLIWGNLGAIIGRLFLRSADRAERIYLAMCARGWK